MAVPQTFMNIYKVPLDTAPENALTTVAMFNVTTAEVPSDITFHREFNQMTLLEDIYMTFYYQGKLYRSSRIQVTHQLLNTEQGLNLIFGSLWKWFDALDLNLHPQVYAYFKSNVIEKMGFTFKKTFDYLPLYAKPVKNGVAQLSKELPGVNSKVSYPCECHANSVWEGKVWNIIQHLNDNCGWSREKIADWIDELHDNGLINAEFQPWEDSNPKVTVGLDDKLTHSLKENTEKLKLLAEKTELSVEAFEDLKKSLKELTEENNDNDKDCF